MSPKDYLNGCMTNPNCEYSLNTPAFVTLAEWINNTDWDPSGEIDFCLKLKFTGCNKILLGTT